jgi:phospholipid/cholesterol/gamma-HCH transport system substrate-binding protein
VKVAGPRLAAVAALVIGALVAAFFLTSSADPYTVNARAISASQLVKGNEVTVAGKRVGTVEEIKVADDSMAELKLTIDDEYAPLRRGTRAIIRQLSLSGQANRYIDLQLGGATGEDIPDGGLIPAQDVAEAVELDEVFDIFDEKTRPGIQASIKLFSEFNAGKTEEANAALQYLSPALASSSRLFGELSSDRTQLRRFIVQSARLTGDLAARDEQLADLQQNLGTAMNAIALEATDLQEALRRFPNFMRRANSTFVNLRTTLDALDPLVETSKPVVRRDLRPLLQELRPFAADAAPTLRDLSVTIRAAGPDNDLVDLFNRQPAVDRIANEPAERNGEVRPGAFPEIQRAMKGAAPQIGFLRPYSNDLVGWFDDFSRSGQYDALGSFSRSGLAFNGFTFDQAAGELLPVPPRLRRELLGQSTVIRNDRCPGSIERPAEDGSNPYVPENIECKDRTPVGR